MKLKALFEGRPVTIVGFAGAGNYLSVFFVDAVGRLRVANPLTNDYAPNFTCVQLEEEKPV